jgi:co-chaperonin GroES (HSP10)
MSKTLILEYPDKAYSGYVLCERGFGSKTEAGLIIPGSITTEKKSLVLSVGPECKYGVKQGDYVIYSQGSDLQTTGPNGGKLFMVLENMIGVITPQDGIYPRPKSSIPSTIPAGPLGSDAKPAEAVGANASNGS